MKKILLLFTAILQLTLAYSQEINYQKTLDDAKSIAAQKNKPIFILINTPAASSSNLPNYSSGIDSKEVAAFYNKNFINYRVSISDSAASSLRREFRPAIFPAYIFLDSKAQLVYKSGGNNSSPQKYLDISHEALKRIASGKTISYYEELNKKGTINATQLKEYISLREELGLFDNAELADQYVDFLSVKSFDDYNEVKFVLQAGPYINGKAYKLCHLNQKTYDSIYKHEPIEIRKAINGHIITNNRDKAIRTKNLLLAQEMSNFIRNSWGKNYREAYKGSTFSMLTYFKAVKDTNNYYWQASNYYDINYLNISADSAKKLQKVYMDRLKESANEQHKNEKIYTKVMPSNSVVHKEIVIKPFPPANIVATELNNAAYDFYLLGTHNSVHLFKALIWCRKAIELRPVSSYYDTMAHIMYRLNFYDEALLNQQKSVEMAMNEPMSESHLKHLKAELDKMKEHTL
jgi:hypothetical protein